MSRTYEELWKLNIDKRNNPLWNWPENSQKEKGFLSFFATKDISVQWSFPEVYIHSNCLYAVKLCLDTENYIMTGLFSSCFMLSLKICRAAINLFIILLQTELIDLNFHMASQLSRLLFHFVFCFDKSLLRKRRNKLQCSGRILQPTSLAKDYYLDRCLNK